MLLAITATTELVFLDRLHRKGGNLLLGCSWQRHPFTNDCSAGVVLRSHVDTFRILDAR